MVGAEPGHAAVNVGKVARPLVPPCLEVRTGARAICVERVAVDGGVVCAADGREGSAGDGLLGGSGCVVVDGVGYESGCLAGCGANEFGEGCDVVGCVGGGIVA